MSFNSLKKFLKNKNNLYFLTILAVAFIIRVFYLISTKGQAMWWDEAEYMSAAKHWGMGIPYELNEQRPPLFQLLAAGLIKFGFEEVALKFILVLLPSIALVVVTYLIGKEMFGYKVALFGALGAGFVWSLVFWSVRFQPDFFSVTLQLLALFSFWKLIKTDNRKFAILAGLFAAIGFYFKISALLVPMSMFIFGLYKDGLKIFNVKNYWIIIGSFILAMIPFMIWQAVSFGSPLAFGQTYSGDFNEGRSIGWETLDFFYSFPKLIFFIFFLGGLITFLVSKAISLDLVLKNKSLRSDPGALSFIVLLVVSIFYLFYIKGTIEDRWIFLIIPFIFFFAANPIIYIYEKISKSSKFISLIFLFIIIGAFIFPQLSHTNNLIEGKKYSYLPVKEGALLIKENSDPEDKILSVSYTQTTAYAEREVITYSDLPIENFTEILINERPKFIMVSTWEPHHPQWILQQVQNEQGFSGVLFPYFNSSIIISPQNQIVQYDIKQRFSNNIADFSLIYPLGNQYGGVLIYKIDYN